jgi:hypothetical protein
VAQTKVWSASSGTTVRRNRSSGATAGQGQAKRYYIGRRGSYDYDTYIKFGLNWTDVGKIVSAVLTVYTDDGLGDIPSSSTSHPKAVVRRLKDSFSEGNAPDGDWQSNDYTVGGYTTSDQKTVNITRAELGVNNIDITAMVEDWAPKSVKRRSGSAGGAVTNYGIGLFGTTDTDQDIGILSEKWTADPQLRPVITLTYEYGPTVPSAPSSTTPSGSIAALVDFQGDFTDVRVTDTLKNSHVQVFDAGKSGNADTDNTIDITAHGYKAGDLIYFTSLTGGAGLSTFKGYYVRSSGLGANTFTVATTAGGSAVNITDAYSAVTTSKLLYNKALACSRTEIDADRFTHVPENLTLRANTNYRWRSRVTDQEGQTSAWTGLITFSFQNTAPNAPTLTPVTGSSYDNPDGILFRGTFSDADAGASMIAYEVQMSAYAEGDAHWEDDEFILWNTGKRYIAATTDPFETPYGGAGLAAGTYYWRARVYDNKSAASNWTYASIDFTTDFEEDPEEPTTAIQLRPRAPWRLVFRSMGANRGPGTTVGIITDAKNVGASELFNSPGELHFTVPKDHPQISVLEPRQTHYSVQFRTGDGWYEKFAGLLTDFDATDTDVVFYGIDYLGLLDFIVDERYDPSNPEKASEKGGSKYVTSGKNSIRYIVIDQLTRAKGLANSPVGFITVGSIATMSETLTVYSTYAPTLQFVVGLLDSHRAGTGKRTRLKVRRTNTGGYEFVVQDNPGQVRDNLRMRYGELVQGYRVVAFGQDFATRIHGIGRGKDGIKVMYDKMTGQGIPEATWGRFTRVQLFDGVSDANDFKRRIRQAAMQSGKLGKQLGIGLRSLVLQPKDGYEVCDVFPIDIEDGSVSTEAFGSGYWACVGVTWQTNAQDGKQETTITFQPREDGSEPDADLLLLQPLSTQAEWQVGYTPPVSTASSRFWFDVASGKTYERRDGDTLLEGITGTA